MLINTPVGWWRRHRGNRLTSYLSYIEQQRRSVWLLHRGKKSVQQGRKGTISQSTLRHLPNYSLIQTNSMTALWVTSTPCARWQVCAAVCCLQTGHVRTTTVITDPKCNITLKPPTIFVWRCSLGVWWLTKCISRTCPLKFNGHGSHHGRLLVRC